jgi:transcriptional regulator with XRE-family HTH domain
MNAIHFGKLIREYRLKRRLTQADLASKLGYASPQFISLIERDMSKTPLKTLGQLIIILEIPEAKVLAPLKKAYETSLHREIDAGKRLAIPGRKA